MPKVTVPTTVDLAAQRVEAGDDIEFIQKFNQFQAKLEQFSSQLAQYTSDFEREYGSVLTLADKATKTDFGVTKLSSSTVSTSENEAATPKAVNDVLKSLNAAIVTLGTKLGKTEKAVDSERFGGFDVNNFARKFVNDGNVFFILNSVEHAFLHIQHNSITSWDIGKAPNRDFFVNRFGTDGSYIDSALVIDASTGKIKFSGFQERTVWTGNLPSIDLSGSWPGDGFYRITTNQADDIFIYAKKSGSIRGTEYASGNNYYVAARCVNGVFKVEGAFFSTGNYVKANIRSIEKIG